MIQVDADEDIIKVLDIDWSQVKNVDRGLTNRLAGFEEYHDQGSTREDMYPLMILERMEEYNLIPQPDLLSVLKEIRELCDKYDCSYFRIINSPITRQ